MARVYCKGRTKTEPKTAAGTSICGTFCGTVGYFRRTALRLCNFTEEIWSGRRGSNSQLSAWEADTLPLSYARSLTWQRVLARLRKVNLNPITQITRLRRFSGPNVNSTYSAQRPPRRTTTSHIL